MAAQILGWGLVVGLLHFVVTGALYGNPWIDRLYQQAMVSEPGVKKWPSRPRYLITQVLGTQVEVYVLIVLYVWFRPVAGMPGMAGALILALALSGARVYPRTWNMWIQSTYPNRLLAVETINGVLSTVTILVAAEWLLF